MVAYVQKGIVWNVYPPHPIPSPVYSPHPFPTCPPPQANIQRLADGLFLECARQVASQYPDIEFRELIIDNACMQVCDWCVWWCVIGVCDAVLCCAMLCDAVCGGALSCHI